MKQIVFFIASIFCLTACNNDVEINPQEPENGGQIQLVMPEAEKVNVYSVATANECVIDSIWVLAFEGNTIKGAEFIHGNKIVRNGEAAQLLPQLSIKIENGYRVICIANSDTKSSFDPIAANVTPSTINTYFKLEQNGYYYGTEHLPMYGEFTWSTSDYTCVMTRAVAKIQVQMGTSVSDVTGNFSAENISYVLYNGAIAGYIQPLSPIDGIASSGGVKTRENYYLLQKEGAKEKETNIFLYEYPSRTKTGLGTIVGESDFHRDRQHILLAKSIGADTTFYRLDFYDSVDKKFLDTKRNHHYTFTINKVRSEGYATRNEAQNNSGSNIEYTVRVEDGSSSITSNGQYAIVTSVDTIHVTGTVTNQSVATVRYQDPTGVLSTTTNSIAIETASPAGSIILNSPTTITGSNVDIKITTTTTPATGTILFKLGNITHRVAVKCVP